MCETQFGCPPTETGRGEGEERNRTPQHNLVAQKKKRLQSALQMLKPVAPTFAGPVRAPGSKSQGGQRAAGCPPRSHRVTASVEKKQNTNRCWFKLTVQSL
jgi:hypothetical protein